MRAMVMRRPRTDGPVAAQQSGNLTTDLAAALPTPTLAAELCPSAWHSDSEYHPSGRRDAADGVPPHRIDGGATGEMGRPGSSGRKQGTRPSVPGHAEERLRGEGLASRLPIVLRLALAVLAGAAAYVAALLRPPATPAAHSFFDSIQSVEHDGARVNVYPGFLSPSEAAEMVRLGAELIDPDRGADALVADGVKDQKLQIAGFFTEQWRADHPLIETLWERTCRVTMIPENSGDSHLAYKLQEPWKTPVLRNIHHDRAQGKEAR